MLAMPEILRLAGNDNRFVLKKTVA